MILFVDSCVRAQSRTRQLARWVLERLDGPVEELRLYPDGPEGLDGESLSLRQQLLAQKAYDHPMFHLAHQFAAADTVVVAAPLWDLAFPAKLRAYLERVTVSGITFRYGDHGAPRGLCRAQRLIYVTTAGGPVARHLGFEYVEAMARTFYGIPRVQLVQAEGLDVWGNDPDAILEQTKRRLAELL